VNDTLEWVQQQFGSVEAGNARRTVWIVTMAARRLQSGQGLQPLFGIVAIVPMRLLQLRDWARQSPPRPTLEVVEPLLVQVMAQRLQRSPDDLRLETSLNRLGLPVDSCRGGRLAHALPPLKDVANC
jgi:hypothetical protein